MREILVVALTLLLGLALTLTFDAKYAPLVWGAVFAILLWVVALDHRVSIKLRPLGRKYKLLFTAIVCVLGALVFGVSWHLFLVASIPHPAVPPSTTVPPKAMVDPFKLSLRSIAVCDAPGKLTLFMVAYQSMYGQTASPVFCLANIQIINQRDYSVTVDRYQLSISDNREGPWIDLVPIPLLSSRLFILEAKGGGGVGKVAFPVGGYRLATPVRPADLAHAGPVTPDSRLEAELTRPIPAHDTIAGWATFDLPKEIKKAFPNFVRISVRDTTGTLFSSVVEAPRARSDDQSHDAQPGILDVTGDTVDMSRFHIRYYSDKYPRRLKRNQR